MNKKGFLRIVEASIGVLIVLGVLLVIASQREVVQEKELGDILPPILDEVAKSPTLREKIVLYYDLDKEYNEEGNPAIISEIEEFIKSRIANPRFELNVRICSLNLNKICFLEPYPDDSEGEMYVSERVVSTTIENLDFKPKKVRVFIWRKK